MDATAIGRGISVIRAKATSYGAHFFAVDGGVVARGKSGLLTGFETTAYRCVDDASRDFVQAWEHARIRQSLELKSLA